MDENPYRAPQASQANDGKVRRIIGGICGGVGGLSLALTLIILLELGGLKNPRAAINLALLTGAGGAILTLAGVFLSPGKKRP